MGFLNRFFNQTRKPEGFWGRVMLSGMNGGGHAKLADFGKVYTAEELTDALKKAGFTDVKITCHDKKPWIAVLATK